MSTSQDTTSDSTPDLGDPFDHSTYLDENWQITNPRSSVRLHNFIKGFWKDAVLPQTAKLEDMEDFLVLIKHSDAFWGIATSAIPVLLIELCDSEGNTHVEMVRAQTADRRLSYLQLRAPQSSANYNPYRQATFEATAARHQIKLNKAFRDLGGTGGYHEMDGLIAALKALGEEGKDVFKPLELLFPSPGSLQFEKALSNPNRHDTSNALQIHSKDRAPTTARLEGHGLVSMDNTSFANVLFVVLAASTSASNSLQLSPNPSGVTKALSDIVTGLQSANAPATHQGLLAFWQHLTNWSPYAPPWPSNQTQNETENERTSAFQPNSLRRQDPAELLAHLRELAPQVIDPSFLLRVVVREECVSCNTVRLLQGQEELIAITLWIPNTESEATLLECLQYSVLFVPQLVERTCHICTEITQTTRTRTIETDQDIIVVFRQFDWQTGTEDVLRRVVLPEADFDLTLRETPEHSRPGKYTVKAIVFCDDGRADIDDQGSTVYYSAAARQSDSKWTVFDGPARTNVDWVDLPKEVVFMALVTPADKTS